MAEIIGGSHRLGKAVPGRDGIVIKSTSSKCGALDTRSNEGHRGGRPQRASIGHVRNFLDSGREVGRCCVGETFKNKSDNLQIYTALHGQPFEFT